MFMKLNRVALVVTIATTLRVSPGFPFEPSEQFLPAMYSSEMQGRPGSGTLTVFGARGTGIRLPMGQALFPYTFSNDGVFIYGAVRSLGHGRILARLRLETRSIDLDSNLPAFLRIYSILSKGNRGELIVSGVYGTGASTRCGLFDVTFGQASTRLLLQAEGCNYGDSWTLLSVSQDGRFAIARREGVSYKINLVAGQLEELPASEQMAYSPNGESIATMYGGMLWDHLVIVSSKDGRVQRDLGFFSIARFLGWSPDSKQLLILKGCRLRFAETLVGTLVIIDWLRELEERWRRRVAKTSVLEAGY